MNEWSVLRLGSALSIKHGYAFPGKGFRDDSAFPTLLTPGNFRIGGGFQVSKTKTFEGEVPGGFRLEPGDLVVTMTDLSKKADTLGYSAVIPHDGRTYLHNQRIGKVIITDSQALDLKFVAYLLRTRPYRDWIVGSASGSTVKHTSPSRIESYAAAVPGLPEQRRIAAVLGAFDALIDSNRVTIESLRAFSASLFDAETAEGEVVPFADVAVLIREGVSGAALAPGTPYLGLDHFGTAGSGITGMGDAGSVDSNKSRFAAGDVLYGKLRPYFRKIDRPGFGGVCSTEIWVLRGNDSFGPATVHAIACRPAFSDFAMQGSSGTRMPRAEWKHVATMPVAVPPEPKRAAVERRLNDIWTTVVGLTDEIADLTRTRDELLPLLMSGKVRVQDVEGAEQWLA